METVKTKEKKAYEVLKANFGYTNALAAPRVVKVIVSSGTGKATRSDKKRNDLVSDRLAKITGQKAKPTGAKKSVAAFKLRAGETIGHVVTLRGARAYAFLDKFINIALPRTRDFRGLNRTIVDDMGNGTFGVKEHVIFPETADEEIKDVFGLAITVVTTAHSKAEATAFFEQIGVPFKDVKVATEAEGGKKEAKRKRKKQGAEA